MPWLQTLSCDDDFIKIITDADLRMLTHNLELIQTKKSLWELWKAGVSYQPSDSSKLEGRDTMFFQILNKSFFCLELIQIFTPIAAALPMTSSGTLFKNLQSCVFFFWLTRNCSRAGTTSLFCPTCFVLQTPIVLGLRVCNRRHDRVPAARAYCYVERISFPSSPKVIYKASFRSIYLLFLNNLNSAERKSFTNTRDLG